MSKTDETLKQMGIADFPFDKMNQAAYDDLASFDKMPEEDRKMKWGRLLTADSAMHKVFDLIKETPKEEILKRIDGNDEIVDKLIGIVATYAIVGNKQGWMSDHED